MNLTTIKSAIFSWVNSNSAGATVVWANQAAPRPVRPYVDINISGIYKVSGQDEERYNAPGNPTIVGHRRIIVSVNYHGDFNAAENLHFSLSKPAVRDALRLANISVINEGNMLNITKFLETGFDELTNFDVEFLATSSENVNTGYIESTEISGLGETFNVSV